MIGANLRWGVFSLLGVWLSMAGGVDVAYADWSIRVDEDRSLSLGIAMKAELSIQERAAPNGQDDSFDFSVTDARFYTYGHLNAKVGFQLAYAYELNETEFESESDDEAELRLLDAVLQYSFSDQLNVWLGRLIVPTDRNALADQYRRAIWSAPVARGVLGRRDGRDDGVVLWGDIDGGGLKYYFGLYEGFETSDNTEDNPLLVGRMVLNFWQPEAGYFLSSSYLGEKDVFALGVSWSFQKEAFYNGSVEGDYWGLGVDFLIEKSLANRGVLTFETAVYDYDADNLGTLNGSNFDNRLEGDGYFAFLGYLLSSKQGPTAEGFQPMVRYHRFRFGQSEIDETIAVVDYGLSYFMSGHDSKVVLIFSDYSVEVDGQVDEYSEIKMAAQLVF
ncbi:MAG: hypothetical protein COB04_03280 [Gammaproteobacteria bacterium]|nr:MAG: hypothetical protein COB04_03280 [Gammaproteobacteria bacterium]